MATGSTKNTIDNLPSRVWEKIEATIRTIGFGSITIIVQDGRVIQIEINEKIRVGNETEKNASLVGDIKSAAIKTEITKILIGLQYGQAVIQIKDGKVTQIDRTEKKRMPRLEGVGGEGI